MDPLIFQVATEMCFLVKRKVSQQRGGAMNRLLKERLIRFAEGNGFEAKTVLNPDGNKEAQLSIRGEVVLSVPMELIDAIRQRSSEKGCDSVPQRI